MKKFAYCVVGLTLVATGFYLGGAPIKAIASVCAVVMGIGVLSAGLVEYF